MSNKSVAVRKAQKAAARIMRNVNRSSPGKGRALVLNAALENLYPGASKRVARSLLVCGSSQKELQKAIAEIILDLAAAQTDPSLGDVYDDIIATQDDIASSSGSSSSFDWSRFSAATDAIGGVLDRGVSAFTNIFNTVTTARTTRDQMEHEQRMDVLAAETAAASSSALANLQALSAATAASRTAVPVPTGPSPLLIGGVVILAGLIGAGIIYASK